MDDRNRPTGWRESRQPSEGGLAQRPRGLEGQPLAARVEADRAHERELARDLVDRRRGDRIDAGRLVDAGLHPESGRRIRIRRRVGEEAVGAPAGECEPPGDVGGERKQRARERVLRVHAEDDGGVEPAPPQLPDQRTFVRAVSSRRPGHPRSVVGDGIGNLGHERRHERSVRRRKQRDSAAAFVESADGGRRHEDVAERVRAYREDPPDAVPVLVHLAAPSF